jgi:hypothetical protein
LIIGDSGAQRWPVEERFSCSEAYTVRWCGAAVSENVGISSIKAGEKPARQKFKGSWATIIVSGLGDPKSRPKGVGDGRNG